MSEQAAARVRRGRITLLLLVVIFALPPLLGWLYFAHPEWLPVGKRNQGTLIQPPRAVDALHLLNADGNAFDWQAWRGQWLIITYTEGKCQARCVARQRDLSQLERALGANRKRVSRLIIETESAAPAMAGQLPLNTYRALLPESEAASFRMVFDIDGASADGSVYLVDPRGNLMMTHSAEQPTKALLKDLELLLKASINWQGEYFNEHG